jgi:hypothetical protein
MVKTLVMFHRRAAQIINKEKSLPVPENGTEHIALLTDQFGLRSSGTVPQNSSGTVPQNRPQRLHQHSLNTEKFNASH